MPTRDDLTWTAHGPFYENVPVITAATTGTRSSITVDASTINVGTTYDWISDVRDSYTGNAGTAADASTIDLNASNVWTRITPNDYTANTYATWIEPAMHGYEVRWNLDADFAAGASDGNADCDECGAELEEAFEAVFVD